MAEKIQGYEFAIDLNDGGMTRSLRTLRDEAKLLKSEMRSNFSEIRSGEGVMAAYAQKIRDAESAINAQKLVIDKLRESQNGLDQTTEKGRQAYLQYENQIESAKRQISSLTSQQERAQKSYDLQASGVLKLKDATEMAERATKSNVQVLESEGRTYAAQKAKLNGLVDVHQKMKTQLEAEKTRMSELSKKYGDASKDAQEQSIRVNELTAKYNANTNEIKAVNRAVGGMSDRSIKARDTISVANNKIKSSFSNIRGAALVASGGIAMVGAAALAGAKRASTLQNSYKVTTNLLVTGGEKVSEATKNVAQMQADGEKYSIKYGKSQKSIADQYQVLVKRGYTSKQALSAMKSELEASVASGDQFSDVVQVASSTLEAFGMRNKNTAKMTENTRKTVNELAYAADMTSTGFQDLGVGMSYVGTSAHTAGASLAETSTAMGILSNNNLEAEKAGTGLRQVFIRLISPTAKGKAALDQMGLSVDDFRDKSGKLKSMPDIFKSINSGMKGMTQTKKVDLMNKLFGTTGQQAALILANNSKELGTLTNKVQQAGDKGTYVTRLAQKNSQTAQMSQARFKQAWSDLTIMFGSELLPYMTDAANHLSKLFGEKSFRKDVKAAAKDVGSVAGGIEKVGVFAVEHTKAVKAFGIALGAIWAVNKIAKFVKSLETLGVVQAAEAKKISTETALVNAQTVAYEANAKAKLESASVGTASGAGSYLPVGSTGTKVTAAAEEAATVGKAGKLATAGSAALKGVKGFGAVGAVLSLTDLIGMTKKTAGSHIGGAAGNLAGGLSGAAAGAAIGSAVPIIGTGIGAAVGGLAGSLGGEKLGKALGKDIQKGLKGTKLKLPKAKAPKISMKSSYDKLNSEAKKYYSNKQKQDMADIKMLYKNGDLTKAEYQKRLNDIKSQGKQAAKFEKMSQSDRNAVAKYYSQSRQKLESKWNKKIRSDSKKWDDQILKDTQRYGANSLKVQQDEKKKSAALKKDRNKKEAALDKQKLKFATSVTAKEAKLHTTLNGKIQLASNKQLSIIQKLTKEKGKLSKKQLQNALNAAQKEYKQTVKLSNQEYSKKSKAAKKQYEAVTKAADRQYKETVAAAKRQYKGNSKYAKDQRKRVTDEALDQLNKTYKHASNQEKSTVDAAEKQRKNQISKAKDQRDQVKSAAKDQSKGVVTHATNQANSSMEANKKQGSGMHSIWKSITDFFNKIAKPFGVKAVSAGRNSVGYTPVSMGAYATGTNGITSASKALVGEAGVEARYRPYSGKIDFVGSKGAQLIDVKPGDQILNARDTAKLIAGNYGTTLPGYAKGTLDIATFLAKAKNGVVDMFSDATDAASDALDKLTNPVKTLTDMAAKAFKIDGVSGVGSEQRSISHGHVNKGIKAIADALKKLKEVAVNIANPAGAGTKRWIPIIKAVAAKMGVKLSAGGLNAVLHRIQQESNGSATVTNHWDSNAKAGHPSTGLLQYIQPTFNQWLPRGFKNDIHSGASQIAAMFNDSNWLRDISVKGGWGPTGHKKMANGGVVSNHQMIEIAENNLPETIVPLDLSKRSRAYQLMQSSLDYFKKTDGGAVPSSQMSDSNLKDVLSSVDDLKALVQSLLGVNVNQVKAIRETAFDKKQLYRQQGLDQSMHDAQVYRK